MKKAKIVFIPWLSIGHIVSTVKTTKLLVEHDNRISTSILVIKPILDSMTINYLDSLAVSTLAKCIQLIDLPINEPQSSDDNWVTYYWKKIDVVGVYRQQNNKQN
jgi:hypothetical protein